jgi:hypothetical protein
MEHGTGIHERKGVLQFEVVIGEAWVEAFLSRTTCEANFGQVPGTGSLMDYYRQYQPMLDRIVLDKISAGARHPVVLMARDLQSPAMKLAFRLADTRFAPSIGPQGH